MSVLAVNGHTHAANEVGIKIDHHIIEDNFKKPLTLISRWTITGALVTDGTSASLNAGVALLDSTYRDGGANYGAATFTANGNVHTLADTGSHSGVRVAAFGYSAGAPWKMHTEMSNRRAFYAVLQAEYRFSTEVMAYSERLTQIGTGGPKWRYMPSLVGQPQYQILQLNTPSRYIHQGMVMLRSSAPVANSSLMGDANTHHDLTRFIRHAPQSITKNGTAQNEEAHMVEWIYYGESYPQLTLPDFSTPSI